MDADKLKELLARSVDPRDINGMGYIVFNDGEVCLTKCGDLFGQRNLHMQSSGFSGSSLVTFNLPRKWSDKNTYACFDSEVDATALREFILTALRGQ